MCFIYVYSIYWLFFNVSFDLLLIFSFLLFKFPKSWEFRLYEKCCVYLAVLLTGPLCFSHKVHWCVLCFQYPLFLPSISLCPYPPLSPKCALSCLGVTPSHSSTFMSQVKISGFSHCQLCISFTSQSLQAHTEPVLNRDCAGTTVLYGNKAMQHLGKAPPLLDVCLFPSKEELRLYVLWNVHMHRVTVK